MVEPAFVVENDDVKMALLMMGWQGGCVGSGHGGSGESRETERRRALGLQTRAELYSPLSYCLWCRQLLVTTSLTAQWRFGWTKASEVKVKHITDSGPGGACKHVMFRMLFPSTDNF